MKLIENHKEYVTFTDDTFITDVIKNPTIVLKTHVSRDYVAVCANDPDDRYPGSSVVSMKPAEWALTESPDKPFKDGLELRATMIEYFVTNKNK